jgi:hypothetical protein
MRERWCAVAALLVPATGQAQQPQGRRRPDGADTA